MSEQDKLTIDEVRHEYVTSFRAEHQQEARQAFDVWLREHNARVWDEGFEAGWAEKEDPGAFVNDVWDAKTPNPYREGQK